MADATTASAKNQESKNPSPELLAREHQIAGTPPERIVERIGNEVPATAAAPADEHDPAVTVGAVGQEQIGPAIGQQRAGASSLLIKDQLIDLADPDHLLCPKHCADDLDRVGVALQPIDDKFVGRDVFLDGVAKLGFEVIVPKSNS